MVAITSNHHNTVQCGASSEEPRGYLDSTGSIKRKSSETHDSPRKRCRWAPATSWSSCESAGSASSFPLTISITCGEEGKKRKRESEETEEPRKRSRKCNRPSEAPDGPRKPGRQDESVTGSCLFEGSGAFSSPFRVHIQFKNEGKKRKRDSEETEESRKRSRKCNRPSEVLQPAGISCREAFGSGALQIPNDSSYCCIVEDICSSANTACSGDHQSLTGSIKRKSTETPDGPRKPGRQPPATSEDESVTGSCLFEDSGAFSSPFRVHIEFKDEGKKRKRDSEETEESRKRSRKCSRPGEGPQPAGFSSGDPGTPSISYTPQSNSRESFKAKYMKLNLLGRGAFGSVHAGYRREDKVPVAIKTIDQTDVDRTSLLQDGKMIRVPIEVALLLHLKPAAGQTSVAVTLLDWYDLDDELILVLERPVPCCNLYEYIASKKFVLPEPEAKAIAKQLLDGLIEITSKGVYHADIKSNNILVETGSEVPRVRLIDFGIGGYLRDKSYFAKERTKVSADTDWFINTWDSVEPSTVRSFGHVVSNLLKIRLPDGDKYTNDFKPESSVQNLLHSCKSKVPPTLKALQEHPWIKSSIHRPPRWTLPCGSQGDHQCPQKHPKF